LYRYTKSSSTTATPRAKRLAYLLSTNGKKNHTTNTMVINLLGFLLTISFNNYRSVSEAGLDKVECS
jgi:hypothetical protein